LVLVVKQVEMEVLAVVVDNEEVVLEELELQEKVMLVDLQETPMTQAEVVAAQELQELMLIMI
jgi:hypothetical protein